MRLTAKIETRVRSRLWLAVLMAGLSLPASAELSPDEVSLAAEDLKKVDPFELRILNNADKLFMERKWRLAGAEYDIFLKKYPKSAATAYVLMRKGRSAQYDNKRGEAINIYNEVMDFFPDSIEYAAPTLFYIGQCQWYNGLKEEALKTWKELVEDKDYRQHRLAAHALNALAERLMEQEQYADAAKYYLEVAVFYRHSKRDAAGAAIEKLMRIHVRIRPDVNKLREVCKTLHGLGPAPRSDWNDEGYFWGTLCEAVGILGQFRPEEEAQKKEYYRYWAETMKKERPADDDFQIAVANFFVAAGGKQSEWVERMDRQFEAYQKPDDYDRVIKWLGLFLGDTRKREQYYAKLVFSKMNNASIEKLLFMMLRSAPEVGRSVYFKLRFNEMDDRKKGDLAKVLFAFGAQDLALDLFRRMKDVELARMEEFRCWVGVAGLSPQKAADFGLPLAEHCVLVPAYARETYWGKGTLLTGIGKLEEAIQAYQMTDDPPKNLYAIVECLVKLGRISAAVDQLREIENFFVNEAPNASLMIAHVYLAAGKRDLGVSELRGVLKKYPGSGQSSTAHNELEAMGITDIRGGEDAQ